MGLIRNLVKKALRRPNLPRPTDGPPSPSDGPANHPVPEADTAPEPKPPAPAEPPPEAPTPVSHVSGGAATEKPWYLDGSNDGWDTTDVKKE